MTKVYYFSGSGHSRAVAEACAELLNCGIAEINGKTEKAPEVHTAVVVFPVYCQNIPDPVKRFLRTLTAKYIVLIATYGRISYGNVLPEAQKLVHGEVIAGAYIPMGHTFLNGDSAFDVECLRPIAERVAHPRSIRIPTGAKNGLADLCPGLRSRVSVRIVRSEGCTDCGLCEDRCPVQAIRDGKITSACIRCLRCVTNCPEGALQYRSSWVLNQYLHLYYDAEAARTLYL